MTQEPTCTRCWHRLSGHKKAAGTDPSIVDGCLWCSCGHRQLCACAWCAKAREPYARYWFVLVNIVEGAVMSASEIYGPFEKQVQIGRDKKNTPTLRVGPGHSGTYIVPDGADLAFWVDDSYDDPSTVGWSLNYDDKDNTYYSDLVLWSTLTDEPGTPPVPWTEAFKGHGE